MLLRWIVFFLCSSVCTLHAQTYTAANAHAHNDYYYNIPLVQAYALGFGSIEADVILRGDSLYVAHDEKDIVIKPLLFEEDYILPLQQLIKNERNSKRELLLLIDLKTAADVTLPAVVKVLEKYPALTGSGIVKFVITGNQPNPATFSSYPNYLYFDGNIHNEEHLKQLSKIALFSENFRKYTLWDGKGMPSSVEKANIKTVINEAHRLGKKIRFWGCPDNINTWYAFMDLKVDYINTDRIAELAHFFATLPNRSGVAVNPHTVYQPLYKVDGSSKKPKNIILLIGDGTGLAQWYAGYTGNRGALNAFNIKKIGLSVTYSADSYITESAAGASAIATGHKTNNNFIATLPDSSKAASIPEIIAQKGMVSGVISTGEITDATPANFYAHVPHRKMQEEIAEQFLSSPVQILIGGGRAHFNSRIDGKNLFAAIADQGYTVVDKIADLNQQTSDKLVLIDDIASASAHTGRGDFLTQSLLYSINALKKNKKGFFIMAEGAQPDWASHNNQLPWMVQEVMDLDKAIGAAMQFVDENKETLLIVTADHETGGLTLLNGNIKEGKVAGQFASDDHSAICVPVFAYGPQSDLFTGVYQNTSIFKKIIEALDAKVAN